MRTTSDFRKSAANAGCAESEKHAEMGTRSNILFLAEDANISLAEDPPAARAVLPTKFLNHGALTRS